jgi:hypothetical protein
MAEFIAEVKFIGRPNTGQVAINFYSIKYNAFIVNRCVRCANRFYKTIGLFGG